MLVEESLTHLLQYRFINRAKRLLCSFYLFRTCELCGAEFQRAAWLRKHQCKYCEKCDKRFPSNRDLERHQNIHTTYNCDACGKAYMKKFNYNTHVASKCPKNAPEKQEDSELGMPPTPSFSPFSSTNSRKCVETHQQYFPPRNYRLI